MHSAPFDPIATVLHIGALIVNGASANPRLFLYELFSELVLMDVGQVGIEHNSYFTRVGVEYRGVNRNSCHSGTSYEVMHSC